MSATQFVDEVLDAMVDAHFTALHEARMIPPPEQMSERTREIVRRQLHPQAEAAVAAVSTKILALHRPWYVIAGERIPNRGVVCDADVPTSHLCQTEGNDRCSEDEHYVDCCYECRTPTEDGDAGYTLWPCATARMVLREGSAVPA